jgi:hypothetical protein
MAGALFVTRDPLFGLPSGTWTVIITPIVLALLARSALRPATLRDGWKVLTPGIGLYGMAAFSALLSVFFFLAIVVFAAAVLQGGGFDAKGWIMIVLGPPLTVMFCYSSAYIFFTRISFNDQGVERRFLKRVTFIAWHDAKDFRRHWLFGPQLRGIDGRIITIWEYLRGFAEITDAARAHGVPVAVAKGD